MNKTLKTIAWICLVLGLMGMVVDVGVLVFSRKLADERQTAFEEMRAEIQPGKVLDGKNKCIAEDTDKDGKPDGDCLKLQAPGQPSQPGEGQPGIGGRTLRRSMLLKMRNNMDGRRFNGRGILPLFFLALGPILVVVGAVILLVNRDPKPMVVKEEKDVKEQKKK
jgi:hypothetical protein